MKVLLVILAIIWLAYRLTSFNAVVNDQFYQKGGIDLYGTIFDTSEFYSISLFTDGDVYSDIEHDPSLTTRHTLLTFLPAIIFIGIVFAL